MTDAYETWLIHRRHDSFKGDMPHSYTICLIHIRRDSQQKHSRDVTDSYETWLIHMRHGLCTTRQTHMKPVSFIRDMTPNRSTNKTWLIIWDMTHLILHYTQACRYSYRYRYRHRSLTGRKVAKLNKFSSAYQLANIQILCTT